jgi:uncharacterized protein (DUF433 family)
MVMTDARRSRVYTPSQVSAATGLSLPALHKAIEHGLIRPRRIKEGQFVRRLLSKSQVLYLVLEAKGLRLLPLATRRQIAKAIERDPSMGTLDISSERVMIVRLGWVRKEVEAGLHRLAQAESMVESDPELMHGTPVYRGTRIPVHAVADMLSQGATVEDILEGYPALTRQKVKLAPFYVKAFPRKGRPATRPWARSRPRRASEHRLAS